MKSFTEEERKYITYLILNQDKKKSEANKYWFEFSDDYERFQKIRYDVKKVIFK